MTEDKNGVKNGEANTEMAPQEDGTKVPLTDNECAAEVGLKLTYSLNYRISECLRTRESCRF